MRIARAATPTRNEDGSQTRLCRRQKEAPRTVTEPPPPYPRSTTAQQRQPAALQRDTEGFVPRGGGHGPSTGGGDGARTCVISTNVTRSGPHRSSLFPVSKRTGGGEGVNQDVWKIWRDKAARSNQSASKTGSPGSVLEQRASSTHRPENRKQGAGSAIGKREGARSRKTRAEMAPLVYGTHSALVLTLRNRFRSVH